MQQGNGSHKYTNYHGIQIIAAESSIIHNDIIRSLRKRIREWDIPDFKVELTKKHYEIFPDGEILAHQMSSVRDADVFIFAQPRGEKQYLHSDIEEIRTLVHTLKYIGSAYRVNLVIPYFPYQKQDRESKQREPVSIKRLLQEFFDAGVTNIITLQLHNPNSKYYATVKVENISAMGFMLDEISIKFGIDWPDYIFASADIGAVKFVRSLAKKAGTNYVVIDKDRSKKGREAQVMFVIGRELIKNKKVWIWDDQIASGGTLLKAKETLMENGAQSVSAGAPHAIFSKNACDILPDAGFEKLVVTDSYPLPENKRFENLHVLSVADLIAGAIDNIHNGGSISGINAIAHF